MVKFAPCTVSELVLWVSWTMLSTQRIPRRAAGPPAMLHTWIAAQPSLVCISRAKVELNDSTHCHRAHCHSYVLLKSAFSAVCDLWNAFCSIRASHQLFHMRFCTCTEVPLEGFYWCVMKVANIYWLSDSKSICTLGTIDCNKVCFSWLLDGTGSSGDFHICWSKYGLFQSSPHKFPWVFKNGGIMPREGNASAATKLQWTQLPTIH